MLRNWKRDRVYIIAEIGGNFKTYEEAKVLIDAAHKCGVDAIKLQTYKADTLSSNKAIFDMENTGIISQYNLFKEYEIGKETHKKIFQYARKKGLDIFSTPSYINDVMMLEELECDAYKIGSDDAVNTPFLSYIAKLGKEIILATGMCTMQEVRESVNVIVAEGNDKLSLMHAITAYPTHSEDVNLRAMQAMIHEFPELNVGYSDHTIGTTACICAAAMGAKIIEKHFTHDKNAEGPDHILSADPEEMKYIVDTIRTYEVMRGHGIKMPAKGEKKTRINNRKSIIITDDILEGGKISEDNIGIKRPGYGIEPKFYAQLIGRTVGRKLEKDDVLRWEDLK